MTTEHTKPEWAQSGREKDNLARVAAGLKPRRRRWPWVMLAIIVVAAGAGWYFISQQPVEEVAIEEAATVPVMQVNPSEISTIEPRTLTRTVKVTGSLAPQKQTQLASQVSGRVVAVMARPGDAVSAGDVLLQLDTESLRIQLDQQTSTAEATRAQLVLAESQLSRTTDLIQRGLAASSGIEQAQSSAEALRANLAALEGQVEAARIALQNATLKAPMDGIISERSVSAGQTVQQGASLFTIVDLDTLELNAAAPVGTSAELAKGQAVTISVEGLAGRSFAGVVDRINPIAVAGTRTIPVYIALENVEELLRGGMFATGQIVVAERADALAVPETALREDAEGTFVLKLMEDRVVRQAIERGESWNGNRLVEISSGLVAGDVVVTAPLTQLQPDDLVQLVEG
ncbi:efflux RND transporter periplasmic adaptor subunit [Devosia sp. YIM 151766]|uniref:efflux RND transporter periplasmic adaptor subunit n=1 Tax=Devosia sp. YIM 151766 TaxID=3017325 RepID=UPI00255CDAB0|nr:efflux RND transporter periplasmic adaptor subunit [Devosia sp. YIM 151766]WIY53207.1 efflux RND transporter periplasmic adaptor subunit [Devosia sp. YIM 151766]